MDKFTLIAITDAASKKQFIGLWAVCIQIAASILMAIVRG